MDDLAVGAGLVGLGALLRAWSTTRPFLQQNVPEHAEPVVPSPPREASERGRDARVVKVLYASQSGAAERVARDVAGDVERLLGPALDREFEKRSRFSHDASSSVPTVRVEVESLAEFDSEELVFEDIVVLVTSTHEGGTPPPVAAQFFDSLQDTANDFRVHKTLLANLHYAVLGIGDSVYDDRWCAAAKGLDMLFRCLSAHRLGDVCLADNGAGFEVKTAYEQWRPSLISELKQVLVPRRKNGAQEKAQLASSAVSDLPDEDSADEDEGSSSVPDLEDLAGPAKAANSKAPDVAEKGESPAMVTPTLRAALTKQGYRIIGSHSGVKLCRWTKAMMRGRGGCYKHTFYGIQSHQCMEMTPSLACANKCVFCWRHHSNPVGREWRWKTDAPEFLIDGAIDSHQSMVKQLRGVPGVLPERLEEGMNVQHCALSLVGEPIMYPFINRFIDLLHEKKISSFMVSNAQFPDQMRRLQPVTQMYISVDASNKDSLKAIDRPVFGDYWERFLDSIDALRENGQRTVFRMTLVHGWNDDQTVSTEADGADDAQNDSSVGDAGKDELVSANRRPLHKRQVQTDEQRKRGDVVIGEYAELAQRGEPGLIEIKGVTFCGTSGASSLTMKNVPFYEEVIDFARRMCAHPALEGKYGVACVHEHSCCVLVAKLDPYYDADNQTWRTWIDYPKFHELIASGKPFTAADYTALTPAWAVDGSVEQGFDPNEVRFTRNRPYQGPGC